MNKFTLMKMVFPEQHDIVFQNLCYINNRNNHYNNRNFVKEFLFFARDKNSAKLLEFIELYEDIVNFSNNVLVDLTTVIEPSDWIFLREKTMSRFKRLSSVKSDEDKLIVFKKDHGSPEEKQVYKEIYNYYCRVYNIKHYFERDHSVYVPTKQYWEAWQLITNGWNLNIEDREKLIRDTKMINFSEKLQGYLSYILLKIKEHDNKTNNFTLLKDNIPALQQYFIDLEIIKNSITFKDNLKDNLNDITLKPKKEQLKL